VPPVDGLDMWDYIMGKVKDSPRTEIMLSNDIRRGTLFAAALIVGDYKLILGTMLYGHLSDPARCLGPVFPNASVSSRSSPSR
jgi:hypothetical protein